VTYDSVVDSYLTEVHRNHPASGYPVGALAGDVARSEKRTRAVVTREIRDSIELLATLILGTNEEDKGTARSQAILTYCALVGAIGVARAVSDQQLSREIPKTVAQLLKNPLAKPLPRHERANMRFRNSPQLRAPRRAALQSHVPDKVTSIFWRMTVIVSRP